MYRRASQGWAADSEMCAIFFLLHVMRWALSEVIGPTKLDVLYGLARTTISLILAPSLSHTQIVTCKGTHLRSTVTGPVYFSFC
uniref:Secreted protein n=1 Tax=Setaria viridis TaxID=4556 RepID=A0A4U6UJ95_SETVI|nr:hypothetical protein SEVIR_5G193766v2 [Setaria viridis]